MSALDAWNALVAQPLRFVAREHLRACFALPLSDQALEQMLGAPRFAARLQALLQAHYRLLPLADLHPAEADLNVLRLPLASFARLPRLCGAVWHGATLSREIRGEVVSELRELLGPQLFNLALQHRERAGAANLLRSPQALLECIDRDGQACVDAWLAAQPPALAAWLRLRLPLAPSIAVMPPAADQQPPAAKPSAARLPSAPGTPAGAVELVRQMAVVLDAAERPLAESA